MTKRILIVEDNQLNLKLFSDVLRGNGFDVDPLTDGRLVIGRVEEMRPDLIVMDIQLPYVSGLDLMREMSARADMAQIPVLAVTAFAAREDEDRIRAAGAKGYIAKPISVLRFVEEVKALL